MSQQQPLDLSITLTPPPVSSGPEVIAIISLRCYELGLEHTGDLLADPLSKKEREDLRWYLEDYWRWPFLKFEERAKEIESNLDEIGKRLYGMVFGSLEARDILQTWRYQPGEQRQISIISDIPRVLSLPWELLHDEQGFLALRARHPVSIIRRIPKRELAALPTSFEPPLRVLLITARPEDEGFVDPRGIARELLDEVEGQIKAGTVALEFLRPPTLSALSERLANPALPPIHLLHFDGHGAFIPEAFFKDGKVLQGGKQGMLAFENEEGKLDLVRAEDLAQILQDSGVRLVVLMACQSAMGAEDNAFSSVAIRLIQGGIDAVAAMSAKVLVVSAARYVEAFYRAIAAGTPVPVAQESARKALYTNPRRHIERRSDYEEGAPIILRDWWLPHYYQQRPLELRPTRPSGQLKQESAPSTARLNDSMPTEPRYGFTGRAYELLQIERDLLHDKLVVIHGFGGNGKTALAREAAGWLTRTHMYEGACFISFEHGSDSALLLSTLGTYLGVYDGNYNPNDSKAALACLQPVLKQKRILLIADNLESILPGGEAPLDTTVRSQLWNTLLELASMGAGLLFTSRDTNFGDGRLSPGKQVAYLPLAGLHPEDAYTLANNLLNDLGIDRARAPYVELRELLTQLDYHPLAIQLVLPALRELSLTQIRNDFAALLTKFVDDTETGRNRSLLASLDYSLRRLTQEQRALLPRLAIFEGGASEDDLLAITEIPEAEWAKLRPALEQAALLTAERVGNFTAPFLHFHPVLTPYLRSQPGADDPSLQKRYTQRYYALSRYLSDEDFRNPQPVRALVRRELPNLRSALELLLNAGKLDDATEMTDQIARFLDNFGLLRERDELRKRIDKAVADAGSQNEGVLTYAEFLRESGLGEDEIARGNLQAAYARFSALLVRIEALPEGTPLGSGSYEHCTTLHRLARCLIFGGQPAAAEKRLREALTIIDTLVKEQLDRQYYRRQRGVLLKDLGDALSDQGQYSKAQEAYSERLEIAEQQADQRGQAVVLTQLGSLAYKQQDYLDARSRYTKALEIFQKLGEPLEEAGSWHRLGMVAGRRKEWVEAEQCYREGLAIRERHGDGVGAAQTCNQLAVVSYLAGRSNEAEGWYKRALEFYEQVQSGSGEQAIILSNLANLLENEVRTEHSPRERLIEAKKYAEQAVAIKEKLDASSGIWTTFKILADIADLEGQTEEARNYRRREREAFAAFEGNRYHIDRQHGQLILDIANAAKGDAQARAKAEAALLGLEERGWHIADTTRRIWAGERDWDSLTEGLDAEDALLVLRVLETIAQFENANSNETEDRTPEQVIAELPVAIREAVERGDEAAVGQAFEALSAEEQQRVMEAMRYLQGQAEEGGDEV